MATRAQVKRALELFDDQLSRHANVVGLGIVPNEDDAAQRKDPRDLAVAVYVKKKVAPDRLAPGQMIPKVLEVRGPKKTIKVPTKVIEQGEVTLEPMGKEPL